MNATMTVTDALAAVDRATADEYGFALVGLADAVRAELAPVPDTAELAAQAERDARTMAPPVPGVTTNSGYTVRSVIHVHDAVPGLLAEWLVACEDERGYWVTWHAYQMDGTRAGRLSYEGGHYFQSLTGVGANRRAAMADLAVRAGTMAGVADRIAAQVEEYSYATAEDKRMARRLRKYFAR